MNASRQCFTSLGAAIAFLWWSPNVRAQERPIAPLKIAQSDAPVPATAPSWIAPQFHGRSRRVPPPSGNPVSPSLRQVIEALRRLPGGADRLERARRSGAAIPSLSANREESLLEVARRAGPSVSDVWFDLAAFRAATLPPLVATVTRSAPSVTVAGVGSLTAEANYPAFATCSSVWGPLDRISYGACPAGGSCVARSWVMIYLNAQTTGWYLINVQATPIAAEMRMLGAGGYNLVTSFPYPTTAGYSSYPVLLNLSAGSHSLSWVNRDFFPYVSEVSVWKL